MAVQRVNVDRQQPYTNPAYDRPQRIPADNRRQREQNVRRENKRQPSAAANTRPTTDEIFNDQYQKAGLQPANVNSAPDQTRKARATYTTRSNIPDVPRTYKSRIPLVKRKNKTSIKKMALARIQVTTANVWIGSWAMFWYLGFQLPLAVVSAAGLGMTYAVDLYITKFTAESDGSGGIFYTLGELILNSISAVIKYAAKLLFGIDYDPMLLFITPFALVFLLGLFQLILTWFIYKLNRINSLSGKAGGIKAFMFALAGVGYAIPILNLFPLIFLWMIVVWIHPK